MPLLMASTFAPGRRGRLPADGPGPRAEPAGDQAALEARRRRVRPVQPRHGDGLPGHQAADGHGPAGHLQRRSRGAHRARRARLALQEARQAGAPQRGPAADRQRGRLPRRLLRVRPAQGLPRVVEHHRHQGRAAVAGIRAGAAVPLDRRARRRVRLVGLPQEGQRRVHPGARSARPSRSAPRSSSSRRSMRSSPRTAGRPASPSTDGTEYYADTVVSALDPRRTFLELVEPARAARRPRREHPALPLPGHVVQGQLRARRPAVVSRASEGRSDQFRGFTNIGPSMDYLERAFDDAKYGWYSQNPYIDMAIQSTIDADMAPPGKHVLSCFIQYTPYNLRESDWDTEKENLGDTVQAHPREVLPGFRRPRPAARGRHAARTSSGPWASARATSSPASSSPRRCSSSGRRRAGRQYRTPIDGYYQCGSGTHPGGCVMGAPGKLAAGQILKDRAKARA